MGKIKKILENELIGGTQSTDVYPVTSTKAVYDTGNKVLDDYIQHLKKTSTFAGIATPTTNPGAPDGNVFYLATTPGTYSNFNGIQINSGEVAILEWRGSWSKKTTGLTTKAELENKSGIYNLDTNVPLSSGQFYTSTTARNAVPTSIRKIGLIITYKIDAATSITEQFIGASISNWGTDTNWKDIGSDGGNKIIKWNTDFATTRKQVPLRERKPGMQISYKHPQKGWVNEQYIGTLKADSEWEKNNNWEQIPNLELIQDEISIYEISEQEPTIYKNKYQTNDGVLHDYDGYVVYEYNVEENSVYRSNASTGGSSCGVCFFNSIGSLIGYDLTKSNTTYTEKTIYTPSGCTKLRLNGSFSNKPALLEKVSSFNKFTKNVEEQISKIQKIEKRNNWLESYIFKQPKTKNLYDKDSLLYGYTLSSGHFIPNADGIFSSRILYDKTKSYTITGVKGYSTFESAFVAFFDSNGNYIGREIYSFTNIEEQITTFKASSTFDDALYFMVLIFAGGRQGELGIGGLDNVQIEYGTESTSFVPFESGGEKLLSSIIAENINSEEVQIPKKNVLLIGASFAEPSNKWFEYMCQKYNLNGTNKAGSGAAICDDANKLYNGKLYSEKELENIDILLIMHVHNKDVAALEGIKEDYNEYITDYLEQNPQGTTPFDRTNYAIPYDYLIKKYMADCYNLKNKADSKYYNTDNGKPCQIIFMTHWHDARMIFNNSIRLLSERWGIPLVELDKNIGFSKAQKHSVTNTQISTMFSQDTEMIDGVTYGWHPFRDVQQQKGMYIQTKIAHIAGKKIESIINTSL